MLKMHRKYLSLRDENPEEEREWFPDKFTVSFVLPESDGHSEHHRECLPGMMVCL